MSFEELPDHIRRPHLRPIQPVPVQKDGKNFVALRDPAMLQKQTMVIPAEAMPMLQRFHGDQTLDELAENFSGNPDHLAQLAKGLDTLGLLWGPTFERLEADRWDTLRASGAFPAIASSTLGTDADACRTAIAEYFEQTEDPELDAPARALVAPHLDYDRGWPNYAAAYYPLQNTDAPDRVVILGTNHFGLGDGVVLTEFGFETPLGRCPADAEVVGNVVERLGRPLVVDQLDHLPEHSIELQIPWIQYCFGDVPVVAALLPDPLAEMIADDGGRVTGEQFVDTLRTAIDGAGGNTLYIASSDLSHVGPAFGEPRPVDEQRRIDVEQHDRYMMDKYIAGGAEDFLSEMRWNKNPTRWCSIGNMAALRSLVDDATVELIDYRQAFDEKGMALVSSAAMVLV